MAQEQERSETVTRDIWKNYSPPTLNADDKQEITCQVGESPEGLGTAGSFCNWLYSTKCKKKISGDNLLEAALIHHCESHDRKFFLKHKLGPQQECIFWGAVSVCVLLVLSFESQQKIDENADILITSICSLTPHRAQICGPLHQWQDHAAKNTRMHKIFRTVVLVLLMSPLLVIVSNLLKTLDKDVKTAIWHYYSAPKLNAEGLSEVTCSVQTGFFANEKCNEKLVGDKDTLQEKALLHYCQCHSNVENKYQGRTRLVCIILLLILLAYFFLFGNEQKVNREIKATITSICALTSAYHKSCRYFKESPGSVFSGVLNMEFENYRLSVSEAVLISLNVLVLLGLVFLVKIIVRVTQFVFRPRPLSVLLFKNREAGAQVGPRELENQSLITDYFPRLDRTTNP